MQLAVFMQVAWEENWNGVKTEAFVRYSRPIAADMSSAGGLIMYKLRIARNN